tara:strand:- start:248 stop:1408 length:1161 start_codon:yes stop_codon:yes gene_type:complete
MPLNLAESALSVAKLGENTLAAMYLGEERIYPNVVTVSFDGGQSQTGTPGQSMTAFTWSISSTDTANYGFTTANAAAATLTGLPAGWVATYANAAGSIPTAGTWTITTVDGNFPTTGVNILTSSLTRSNPQTGFGTLSVTFTGNSTFTGISGTYNASAFIGSTASAGATAPVTSGNAGLGNTDIGYIIGPTWSNSASASTTVSGGTASIGSTVQPSSGSAQVAISVGTTVTIGSIGTVSGTTTYSCSYATAGQVLARVENAGINSPPWGGGSSGGPQWYANTWGQNCGDPEDWRNDFRLKVDVTCSGSCSYNAQYFESVTQRDCGSSGGGSPPNGWTSRTIGGSGAGTYTVTLQSTFGSRPEAPTYTTAPQNNSGWGTGPVTSNMT